MVIILLLVCFCITYHYSPPLALALCSTHMNFLLSGAVFLSSIWFELGFVLPCVLLVLNLSLSFLIVSSPLSLMVPCLFPHVLLSHLPLASSHPIVSLVCTFGLDCFFIVTCFQSHSCKSSCFYLLHFISSHIFWLVLGFSLSLHPLWLHCILWNRLSL